MTAPLRPYAPLRTLSFPPPGLLLSMNDRGSWRKREPARRLWQDAVYWHAVKGGRLPTITVPVIVDVALPVKGKRRRDPANFASTVKVVVDALCLPKGNRKVGAGWFVDDDSEWMTLLEPTLVIDGDLVTVTVWAR
jgi:hypothetical protein